METNTHQFGNVASTSATTQGHRVLRNTYALLALSMIPTAIGATLGVKYALPLMASLGIVMQLVLFFVGAFGLMYLVQKNRNNSRGVALLLLFTLFMGFWLGPMLSVALQLRNGGQLITLAAGGTGAIFFTLAGIASTTKRDFSKMGNFLIVGAVLLVLASIANAFLQIPALALAVSSVAILVFSAFILYDINRIVHGGETSYVSATLGVYLDLYNIFTNLLHLLMAFFGGDD